MLWIMMPPLLHLKIGPPDSTRRCMGRHSAVLADMSRSLNASSPMFSVNNDHWLKFKGYPVSFRLRRIAVIAIIAREIQKRTKKPRKLVYSLRGSKCETRGAYSIVGNRRDLFCARICRRTEDVACVEGGASEGMGVVRPLFRSEQSMEYRRLGRTWRGRRTGSLLSKHLLPRSFSHCFLRGLSVVELEWCPSWRGSALARRSQPSWKSRCSTAVCLPNLSVEKMNVES